MTCAVCGTSEHGPWQAYGCGHAAHTKCDRDFFDRAQCPECGRQSTPPLGSAPGGVQRCADCHASLGTLTQTTMLGVPQYCYPCERRRRIDMMLKALPDPDGPGWEGLSEFEQQFLPSVREQFIRKRALSDKQAQILERIWAKV